uniref:Uncharacterized protein n=1 Tax=Setaria italica TaxID=4555 RepID=K4ANP4_SETIT
MLCVTVDVSIHVCDVISSVGSRLTSGISALVARSVGSSLPGCTFGLGFLFFLLCSCDGLL